MSGQIFISYRRHESHWSARSLCDRLCMHFGRQKIFMDVNLYPGDDFPKVIEDTVAECDVLIAIIGRQWLTCKDEQNVRRLDNPEDFVRNEIAVALKREIPVIPILVDGAQMPRGPDLPEDLKSLVRKNFLPITETSFDHDCQLLAIALEKILEKAATERIERERKKRFNEIRRKFETILEAYLEVQNEHLKEALVLEIEYLEKVAAGAKSNRRIQTDISLRRAFAAKQLQSAEHVVAISYGDHAYFIDDHYVQANINLASKDPKHRAYSVRRIYLLKRSVDELVPHVREEIERQRNGHVLLRVAYKRQLPASSAEKEWLLAVDGNQDKFDESLIDDIDNWLPPYGQNLFIADTRAMTYSSVNTKGQPDLRGFISVDQADVRKFKGRFENIWNAAFELPSNWPPTKECR
jgi:hypothetical protein